ncbi:MAG: TlpA family protein disulfide reductase [Candidatus Omnitrophica bacterium]|nr:TlpA family protein disulfide reductase [Candidatus Omnitrophota bacterium]
MKARNLLFLLLAGIILIVGCSSPVESADKKASDFSLENINNKTERLSDHQNKVIILNFFATWCPPCKSEIPDFIELMDEYGDDGFVIIGVSLDRGGVDEVKAFAEKYKINYPLLMDDGQVSNTYGPVQSIPTTFIIDKDGVITEKIIGARKKDYFEDRIKPLL